jgi:hypothetical protein
MSISAVVRCALAAVVVVVLQSPSAQMQQAQQRGGTPQTDKVAAVNTGANPYRAILDWAKFTTEQPPQFRTFLDALGYPYKSEQDNPAYTFFLG